MYYQVGIKLILNYALLGFLIKKIDKFLKTKAPEKPLWDIIHSITPEDWSKYHLLPDYFVIANTLLFLPELVDFDLGMINYVGNVYLYLHWLVFIGSFLTAISCPAKTEHLSCLSGHTIQTLLTTLIINQISRSDGVIVLSWVCTVGTIISAILTRNHYTIDIYSTIIIVYLSYQQYLNPID